jgi:hypothetical protein
LALPQPLHRDEGGPNCDEGRSLAAERQLRWEVQWSDAQWVIQSIDCKHLARRFDDPVPTTRTMPDALTHPYSRRPERPAKIDPLNGEVEVAASEPAIVAFARMEQSGIRPEQRTDRFDDPVNPIVG